MSEEIYQSLKEMVDMMNCGDEYGKDSPWHQRATKALNEYSQSATQELLRLKELECEQLAKDKKEFIRFANGAIFTMGKAKKHNELSSHDDEMIRQRIEQAKQLLERIG